MIKRAVAAVGMSLALIVPIGTVGAMSGCEGGAGEGEGEGEEGEGEEGEGEEGEGEEGEGEEGEGEEGEGEPIEPFFIGVGSGGRRMSSPDGTVWDNDDEDVAGGGDDDDLLRASCAGPGFAVAVGGSQVGRMMVTADGGNFQTFIDDFGWLGGCAVGNGVVVAAGSNRSIRSIDGGFTWIDPDTDHFYDGGSWQMRDATFLDDGSANGLFVAAGDLGMSLSVDGGVTWSEPAGPRSGSIAAGNGAFVAIGNQRSVSTDGLVWASEDAGDLRDVVFDGVRFVAVGSLITHFSTDGAVWDEQVSDSFIDLVAYGDVDGDGPGAGVYISSTFPNDRRVSSDALTWTRVENDDGNFLTSLSFVE